MRRKDGLFSLISVALVVALLAGLCASLLASGRSEPNNPIDAKAEYLNPESLQGSGILLGSTRADGDSEKEESEQPPTEETQPPSEPDDTQPSEPDATEPTEADEGEDDPTTPPATPNDNQGDHTGGTTADDENGGLEDSSEDGDGDAGNGTGGEENDKPRIRTDLGEYKTITKSELPDGILSFYAFPEGNGENLSVRVRLKNNTYSGNGTVLNSPDGKNYRANLDFNAENTFVLTLWEGSTHLLTVQYRISYFADKADEDKPEVGDYPPSIVTNLDGVSLDMTSRSFPLTVIARTHSELGAEPIYSNHTEVRLDGNVVQKSYGDSQQVYELNFEPPQRGDEEDHIITILAWDGQGNSTMKIYTVTYHQISEGDDAGTVTVVLDATTVGLGVLDSGTLSIVEGETVASVVLRFLEEYGYEADYAGNANTNFYLRRILRGDMAYRASAQHWETLWNLILRDGITTNRNYDRDSLGEFDFTQGSGWMYSIGGTLYEGTGMSGYKVRNGITIYLRFTMSYGKDIGGYDATGGGYGKLSSYCGVWINGGYQPLEHDFQQTDRVEPTQTEDGYVEYTCSKCQEIKLETLPMTETEPNDPGGGTDDPGGGTDDPGGGTDDPGGGTDDPGGGTGDPGGGTGDPGGGTDDPGGGTDDPDDGTGDPDDGDDIPPPEEEDTGDGDDDTQEGET